MLLSVGVNNSGVAAGGDDELLNSAFHVLVK